MSQLPARPKPHVERELRLLREKLGLREDQGDDLLEEITRLAAWCVTQAAAGSRIVALTHQGADAELIDPALERLQEQSLQTTILLSPDEATQLEALLATPPRPTPELQRMLERLARGESVPPEIVWKRSGD